MSFESSSGDAELVAATAGASVKIQALKLYDASAATVTIRSGGDSGTVLDTVELAAGETKVLGNWRDTAYQSDVGENIYVSADAGTLAAYCKYTHGPKE